MKNTKSILAVILALVCVISVFALASCGANKDAAPTETNATGSAASSEKEFYLIVIDENDAKTQIKISTTKKNLAEALSDAKVVVFDSDGANGNIVSVNGRMLPSDKMTWVLYVAGLRSEKSVHDVEVEAGIAYSLVATEIK